MPISEEAMAAAIAAADAEKAAPAETKAAAPAPTAGAPSSAAKPEEPKLPSAMEKSFEKLLEKSSKLRKEEEAVKAQRAEISTKAQKFAKFEEAIARGDAQALLAAAGFDGQGKFTGPEPESELAVLKAELKELKEQISGERRSKAREAALKNAEARAKEKFPMVSELEKTGEAMSFLRKYYAEHGELPADTEEESMDLALEYVQQQLEKEKAKWEKVLTAKKPGAKVDAEEAPEQSPAAPSERAPKTLTNAMTSVSPAKKVIVPRTAEDYRAAALAAWNSNS